MSFLAFFVENETRLKTQDSRHKMGDLAFLPEASMSIKQSRRHEVIKN